MSGRPSLVIFDLDHTLSHRDTFLQYLGGFLLRNPARILRCIGLPLAVARFYLGLIDNGELKERFLSAVLGGAHCREVEAWTQQFVSQMVSHGLNQKALDVLRCHREAGDFLVLMTASPDCYVVTLGRVLGFEEIICTATEHGAELISGRLIGANVRGIEKLRKLEDLRWRFPDHFITAYADDSSDVPLLMAVDRGVLVNGNFRARAQALKHGLACSSWSSS